MCCFGFSNLHAQSSKITSMLSSIKEHQSFEQSDISYRVVKNHTDTRTEITHMVLQQQHNGIDIYKAIANLTVKDDVVVFANSKFIPIHAYTSEIQPSKVDAKELVRKALASKNVFPEHLHVAPSRANRNVYTADELIAPGVLTQVMWFVTKDQTLVPVLDLSFEPKDGSDLWSQKYALSNGELMDEHSLTTHCKISGIHARTKHHACTDASHEHGAAAATLGDGAQYRVYPLPAENPYDSDHIIISEPADAIASPYGWHDDNSVDGAEYTSTRGNNVHAILDRNGDYNADREISGGSELIFDFPVDHTLEPLDYEDAATVNLFYMNNMMHDFTYHYGFDVPSGNFQSNKYGVTSGQGQDHVNAYAQFDADGVASDNADFSTPNDGGTGQMRMFLWQDRRDISVFKVNEPAAVAGAYDAGEANFGLSIDTVKIEGEVVLVQDGTGITTDACQDITNGSELNGKIVLIDRGECEFGFKILAAENEGAIGVIICNNVEGGVIGMAPGAVGDQVTIPSVFLTKDDCAKIRVFIGSGLSVQFEKPETEGPARVDGDLDNGIVAHEYGHGISNRLTGGPDNSSCLGNTTTGSRTDGEQMGEGWSDFFSLVTTVKTGDVGADARGIGNYAVRYDENGPGIRAFPYSTDLAINPLTYYDVYDASVPHGVGTVWCSMLWDLYWKLVDKYGWDEDLIYGTGGNNIAIQLVMDGMKMQVCDPGFIDGRDAILAADQALNGGANQGEIWEVFARRGLGFYAEQGSSDKLRDGKEDYTVPPQFIETVKLEKIMSPTIDAGEDVQVDLIIRNDTKEEVTNIEVMDELPLTCLFDMTRLPANFSIDQDKFIIGTIPSLASGENMTITYYLKTENIPSVLIQEDDMNTDIINRWSATGEQGSQGFQWVENIGIDNTGGFVIPNSTEEAEQDLLRYIPFNLDHYHPMIRYQQKFDIEAGSDGVFVEMTFDQGENYVDVGEHLIRNGYNNRIARNTVGNSDVNGFSGNSDGWQMAYLDLKAYNNEPEAYLRFHYESDNQIGEDGYYIDNLQYFHARTYNSEACLDYDGSTETICASAADYGTIVNPDEYTSTENPQDAGNNWSVFPNPATQILYVSSINDLNEEPTDVRVYSTSGQLMYMAEAPQFNGSSLVKIDVSTWSKGIYHLELLSANKREVYKVAVH